MKGRVWVQLHRRVRVILYVQDKVKFALAKITFVFIMSILIERVEH